MSEYKETSVIGQKFTRCHTINLSNPRNGLPSAQFSEEEVIVLGENDMISRPVGGFTVMMDNPMASIEIRNPMTYEKTGQTITFGEIYAILFSAYWDSAEKRDLNEQNNVILP